MHCPNCGYRMSKNASICMHCGTKMSQIKHASHQAVAKARKEYQPEKIVYTTVFPTDLNFVKTLLMCIFLGLFGGHYFYVKRPIPGLIFLISWTSFLIFLSVCGAVCGTINGMINFHAHGMEMPFIFMSIVGALVAVYWVSDIIRISLKRFKVPVVLEDK